MIKKIISIMIILIIVAICSTSYAAINITPSKTGTDSIVNIKATVSYEVCQQMNQGEESLVNTTVKPHLATNKDWGAVSYFANSVYGTNGQNIGTGNTVQIDGVEYYSTTPNITGVMNWGANPKVARYTQTAGLIQAYNEEKSQESTAKENVIALYNNRDTDFVDYINTGTWNAENTLGMAMYETESVVSNDWGYGGTDTNRPMSIRQGWFGFYVGHGGYFDFRTSGAQYSDVTFRPVIWNR